VASILFVLVFFAVLAALGFVAVSKFDRQQRLSGFERVLFSFATGCYAIYFGVFAIGYWRLDSTTMGILAGVLILTALPVLGRLALRDFGRTFARVYQMARGDRLLALLWLAVIGVGLSAIIQGMAPPNDYDSLMYHLSYPQHDIELGRIAVPWGRDSGTQTGLFPAMMSNMTRFALALTNAGVAQMLHGVFGLLAAAAAAALALRLKMSQSVAVLAALLFLSIRFVVWEMATVEVDIAFAAFSILAMLAYTLWRQHETFGLAAIFGLMIGAALLTKYQGYPFAAAFGPLILYDRFVGRKNWSAFLAGPAVAFCVIVPHLARNAMMTGNPLFPLLNNFFNPEEPVYFETSIFEHYGPGMGLLDLIMAPWNFSILPMQHFDGMVLGAPYLLALVPLVVFDLPQAKRLRPMLTILGVFFVVWFYLLNQQVRFLSPVMPLLAIFAAAGATALWRAVRQHKGLKPVYIALIGVLFINQSMFVGIYSAIRLPVALGLMTAETFHSKTPTMTGAMYGTCTFIRRNLKPGEQYFSVVWPHSFYCPQVSVTLSYFDDEAKWWRETDQPPEMNFNTFMQRVETANFRYFFVPTAFEQRRNDTAKAIITKVNPLDYRFGNYLQPVLSRLQPVFEGHYSAVYDGPAVIELLKDLPQPE
jgi:hypothetical protein